jgi:hypothetical protein
MEGPPNGPKLEAWLKAPETKGFRALTQPDRKEALSALVGRKAPEAISLLRALPSEDQSEAINLLPEDSLRSLLRETLRVRATTRRLSKIPPWSSLRSVGNFALFKVSYVALLILPWVSRIAEYMKAGGYTYIGAIYFGDLFLALANLVYDIRCPAVVKRWESPNDFYIQMLDVAIKQKQSYPDDDWIGNLEHSKSAYLRFAYSRPAARLVCVVLYFFGLSLLVYVLVERSWHVLHPILNN